MKIIIEKTYEDMSYVAGHILLGKMYQNKRMNISITAGTTPIKMYEYVVPFIKDRDYFKNVYFYNFDELPVKNELGLGITVGNLYHMFFKPANIARKNIVVLDETNYTTHMDTIRQDGGLELMIMGLGADGHFCGNLPHTSKFDDEIVKIMKDATPTLPDILLKEVKGDTSRVPDYYVTMGPKAVMETKEIVMIVSGKAKAEIVKKIVEGPITEDVPASILKLHPNFTLLLDAKAASLLE
jgi:6-phosphogluconolactonase/glucosamine-6-phosphate isomerase/deaminase